MKNKKKNQVFKVIFIFLFIAYITIYTSQKSGYMDFQNYKKMSLTKEKIKEFESDIKAGKKVDLTKYSTNTTRNYSNKFISENKSKISFPKYGKTKLITDKEKSNIIIVV